MKRILQNWKTYALWILLAEAVGGLSGWLTREGTKIYQATVAQPPLSPPPLVFPIVWGILFALMGIGAARIYLSPVSAARTRSLLLFLVQLFCGASSFSTCRPSALLSCGWPSCGD